MGDDRLIATIREFGKKHFFDFTNGQRVRIVRKTINVVYVYGSF